MISSMKGNHFLFGLALFDSLLVLVNLVYGAPLFFLAMVVMCMMVCWACYYGDLYRLNGKLGIHESQLAIWSPLIIGGCHCKRCFIRRCDRGF